MRFAHLGWDPITEIITAVWGHGTTPERRAVAVLTSAVDSIGTPWATWRDRQLDRTAPEPTAPQTSQHAGEPAAWTDALDAAITLARVTGDDGRQRALDRPAASLAELQRLRLTVRKAILALPADSPVRHVRPWIWNATTSGGPPLTATGQTTGYELRFSRYRHPTR